nr:hypothetical protein [Ceratocystis fimbriata]WPM94782.1 hypothetical protein [Ceratocystis fimbriata]
MILLALYLANCWEKIFILFISLSAGCLISLDLLNIFRDYTPKFVCYKGSHVLSETRTWAYLNSKLFSTSSNPKENTLKEYNKNNEFDPRFASYLAGLIEGDGTIIVPKSERSPKGKLYYPSIQIVFDLRDLPLAIMIQSKLNHGSVSRKKGSNAYVFSINSFEGLILVTNIINGFMRTPKIYALYRLIDWLNLRFNLNIEKKYMDKSNINSNNWLAGFIDADGHFSVRTTLNSKYPRIECKFELSQRQNDHNNENNFEYLSLIADFLSTTVKEIRMDKPKPEYRVRTTSLNGNLILIEYLDKYPLFSSKYLNYNDWKKVLAYFENKKHTEPESIKSIVEIKLQMNNQRTEFVWDHLSKFYNLYK